MLKRLGLLYALVLLSSPCLAADGRIAYVTADGSNANAAVVSPVCSVSSDGTPETCADGLSASVSGSGLMSYKTKGGMVMRVLPVVPVCSVNNAGVPQICDMSGGASDLSAYLTTAVAAATYAHLKSPAFTGTPTAPTPAATDNSTAVATTAFVNNAFQSVEYSSQGDVSTAGSSIQVAFGTSGLYAKLAYAAAGAASMSFCSSSGTLSPVDIRRNSIWGGSGVETYTLDNGSVDTSCVTADSTVYTSSQDSSAYFIRVGGAVYFLTVWASNNGARAFMGVHKMI